ncbi:glycosyltransferase [Geotalea uraniireducens]|uniref:Glycosyl transferase, family 2 n=1 Tax=Geotalea uraniireducens (strain Rf4) TaxID=351605 RepID=A5G3Z4_GEOUR|nr:glycosyltransferase [Geotalea uraniireducens]ABQ26512.1 glycosyl transferase, family 2 [Geotalea uraniireducens Rf4]
MTLQDFATRDIAFILPTLNEEAHIGGVLDTVREHAGHGFSFEVIVVDNGSSDRTVEIAVEKGAICLRAPGCTISSLRNLGASRAGAGVLIFLDADVYLGQGWGERIGAVIARLHLEPDIITGSLYGISDESNWIERIWFAPRTTRTQINYINGGHLIIHRSLFSTVGGFDPKLETGEDCEFCARARTMGARIENDPGLRVVHAGYPKSVKRFFARERWHGRGDYRSVKTLASSKPALLSLANLCMAVTCTIGIVSCPQPWWAFAGAYVLFLACVSLAAAIHRYRGKLSSGFLGAVFLYMVYITARTVSMVDVVIQSLTVRRPVRASG